MNKAWRYELGPKKIDEDILLEIMEALEALEGRGKRHDYISTTYIIKRYGFCWSEAWSYMEACAGAGMGFFIKHRDEGRRKDGGIGRDARTYRVKNGVLTKEEVFCPTGAKLRNESDR